MKKAYYKPTIFHQFPRVVAAQSTRHGGVSPPPYHSLNIGINTRDDDQLIAQNRKRFFNALGLQNPSFTYSHQIHGKEVFHAQLPASQAVQGFDAIISNQPNLLIGVTIADCCPVLIYDTSNQAFAAIHAGWRGTVAQIVKHTLDHMQTTFGTQASNCFAFVGTCISQSFYEVDEQVAQHFNPAHKTEGKAFDKWHVDLRASNRHQLIEWGLPHYQVEVSPFCTWANNEDYFSHRREKGTTGRMLAVIGMFGKEE
jgi:YfiH family protein